MNENEIFEAEQAEAEATKPNAQKDFLDSLQRVNSSYLTTVIACACIAVCGIAIALHLLLWLGVAVAFSSAIIYIIFTKLILRKNLGISYQSTSGAISLTKLCANGREEIFVPRRLFWVDVTEIADKAFSADGASNIRSVHLPATLTAIGENIFEGCQALKTVYFEGTREEWEAIDKATDFETFELVFSDGSQYDIKKEPKPQKEKKKALVDTQEAQSADTEDDS